MTNRKRKKANSEDSPRRDMHIFLIFRMIVFEKIFLSMRGQEIVLYGYFSIYVIEDTVFIILREFSISAILQFKWVIVEI